MAAAVCSADDTPLGLTLNDPSAGAEEESLCIGLPQSRLWLCCCLPAEGSHGWRARSQRRSSGSAGYGSVRQIVGADAAPARAVDTDSAIPALSAGLAQPSAHSTIDGAASNAILAAALIIFDAVPAADCQANNPQRNSASNFDSARESAERGSLPSASATRPASAASTASWQLDATGNTGRVGLERKTSPIIS